jgi:DNA repair protein RadC
LFFSDIYDKSLLELQELVYIIYLNNNNKVISWIQLNKGTCSETLFDIKFALACALGCMASKIIIAHNHPSGKLTPSPADIEITKRFINISRFLDIVVEDHLIIGRDGYFSFADHDLI